ncbi:hypothetical protein [Treponema sp. R6D11]
MSVIKYNLHKILAIEIKKYYLKYMIKLRKYFLPILIIILLFSCKKSDNNAGKEDNISEQSMAEETPIYKPRKEQKWIDKDIFEEKMKNDTVAAEIAVDFAYRNASAIGGPPWYQESGIENVPEIEAIIPVQGYYIQQSEKQFANGRSPEILVLSVKDKNVYIREIDLVKGEIVTRKEILLQFNGKTFAHNRTKLETENEKIQILYLENAPEQTWRGPFEYEIPYTFAGNLDDPIKDNVRKLTSDYLETFTGYYDFDSCKIIESDRNQSLFYMQNDALQIVYNKELKCLTVLFSGASRINLQPKNFIETDDERIFYWIFGEGAGYKEDRLYFYKGGIVYTRDYNEPDFSSRDENDYPTRAINEKYVIFFKKEM